MKHTYYNSAIFGPVCSVTVWADAKLFDQLMALTPYSKREVIGFADYSQWHWLVEDDEITLIIWDRNMSSNLIFKFED